MNLLDIAGYFGEQFRLLRNLVLFPITRLHALHPQDDHAFVLKALGPITVPESVAGKLEGVAVDLPQVLISPALPCLAKRGIAADNEVQMGRLLARHDQVSSR